MQARTYGTLLVSIATIMWSTAGLFVRALDLDVWTVLGWRSLFGGLALAIIIFAKKRISAEAGKVSLYLYPLFGLMAAISMYGYIGALKLTTVANVLAIYATVPFVAAAIAYLWMREKISRRVLIASLIAFVGVLIVAGFSARPQDIAGNALAFLMTLTFSVLLVAARRYPALRLAPVNALGSGFCVLLCLPLMSHVMPSPQEILVLALFGSTTSGIAYLLFMTGGRYIPSSEAGLIGLLDVVLGPLWVWLVFSETPALSTIIGGGIILISVFWYLWSGVRGAPPRRTLKNV
ncbi:DMT family transporter [Rhizobium mesoamericanum]|uniref:Permease n=1 Tax=Rhizobium mesoamericanum STM3625 TaxID=1211777 RepID=K0PJI7_9HYPH|nr:DMT family transporter [Rhizobium mesoamericanum]MDQ0563158.1 drug/metabolite transporter (DMT)-like permease [Rhizobium mesoamericanum]CCM74113.1 Permease [Rhizobium mesoamericanum STM3625]